jgi:hypothetical protein
MKWTIVKWSYQRWQKRGLGVEGTGACEILIRERSGGWRESSEKSRWEPSSEKERESDGAAERTRERDWDRRGEREESNKWERWCGEREWKIMKREDGREMEWRINEERDREVVINCDNRVWDLWYSNREIYFISFVSFKFINWIIYILLLLLSLILSFKIFI